MTNAPASPLSITRSAQKALDRTREWIERFGGRLAGTDACRNTAEALCLELRRACGSADLERFTTHPGAFTGFYRIDVVLYVVGLALMAMNQPLLAGIVLLWMVVGAGLEFGWYVELYDRFYPKKECYNVTATLEPRQPARQTLIISGHHDSAQELSFLKGSQKLYGLKIIVPDFFRFLAMMVAWAWVLWGPVVGGPPPFMPYALWLLVVGLYFVFTKFFLFSRDATPGAGDNLIASAMLVELAQRLAQPGQAGRSVLDHTRLVFLSFDAEESGVRGSRAWVKAHRAELAAMPTLLLNIDSIYRAGDLQFMLSDLNAHVKLDRKLAEICARIAGDAGYPAGLGVMRFGGGATDAVTFARAGVRATTMIAMSTRVVRDGLVYHTMRDTVDAIEPVAVEACLSVAERLAFTVDRS